MISLADNESKFYSFDSLDNNNRYGSILLDIT